MPIVNYYKIDLCNIVLNKYTSNNTKYCGKFALFDYWLAALYCVVEWNVPNLFNAYLIRVIVLE
jgi:hypothetical protein